MNFWVTSEANGARCHTGVWYSTIPITQLFSNTAGSFMCLRKIKGLITRWFLNIIHFKQWINIGMKTWFNIPGKSCNTELQMKALMTKRSYFNDLLNEMWVNNLYILILHKHNSLKVWIVIFSHLTRMCRRAQFVCSNQPQQNQHGTGTRPFKLSQIPVLSSDSLLSSVSGWAASHYYFKYEDIEYICHV